MRDKEVIATVCRDPKPDADRKTNGPVAYEVFAMQNTPSAREDDPYFQPLPPDGTELMPGVVTNPGDKDNYFKDINDCTHCLIVPKGKSHLGDINGYNTLAKCLIQKSIVKKTFYSIL